MSANQSCQSIEGKEHKTLAPATGLVSCFLHLPSDCWWKRCNHLYAGLCRLSCHLCHKVFTLSSKKV